MSRRTPTEIIERELIAILTDVAERGAPCPLMTDMAERIGCSVTGLQARVRALVAIGVIEREMHAHNRIRFRIVASGKWTDWTARSKKRRAGPSKYWKHIIGDSTPNVARPPLPEWALNPRHRDLGARLLGDPVIGRSALDTAYRGPHARSSTGVSLPHLTCLREGSDEC